MAGSTSERANTTCAGYPPGLTLFRRTPKFELRLQFMSLHLYNTLSGTVEDFRPLHGNEVRMYACGPTVYDFGHIGNFRTFVAVDILRRFFLQSGLSVRHVMN